MSSYIFSCSLIEIDTSEGHNRVCSILVAEMWKTTSAKLTNVLVASGSTVRRCSPDDAAVASEW